jgi:hypothetical protein
MRIMTNSGRRGFLIGGIAAGVAGLLPINLEEPPRRMAWRGRVGDIAGAAVPSSVVSLADYGGMPGAGRPVLVDAFGRAFAALAEAGGGTLFVAPGLYDFGNVDEASDIILCRNLRNIAISAYGATFTAATRANVVPNMFYFFNFNNLTIAGASFIDTGFDPWVNWKGMYCVGIQADEMSSGFRMVDCYAERVVGLLASNNNAAGRMHLSNLSVEGEVRDAYYGVGANFVRDNVKVELVCHNVRRAFIAYSLKDAEIRVKARSTSNWPGSNGLVALVSGGASTGNVERVRVEVDVSGDAIHGSYVHFYHQGPEAAGVMRDIDATVNLVDVSSAQNMFVFDHETEGVQAKTSRVWDRISLHGTVTGKFEGKVVSNASVTTSPGTVYLDANLARLGQREVLASVFRVRDP